MKKIILKWNEFEVLARKLAKRIRENKEKFDGIYGIPRGGLVLAVKLSHELQIPLIKKPTRNTLIVDDISDTGKTLKKFKNNKIVCLYTTPWTEVKPRWYGNIKENKDHWIIFPWENQNIESLNIT